MNRSAVPAKVIAPLRDAIRFREAIKDGSPPRIIDEEQVRMLYKNLTVTHTNESVLGMAVALRKTRVETTAWTRTPHVAPVYVRSISRMDRSVKTSRRRTRVA